MKKFKNLKTSTPYHLLVVDDERSCRLLASESLRDNNCIVSEASNAEEAIKLICENDYDVVLLDKNMPDMKGDELCQYIRNDLHLPLLPIIMVTGNSANDELVKSMELGANDFIRKPYVPSELVSRVNSAANQKRLTDQLDSSESLLFALARMVEAKDEYTGDHCSRLSHTSVVFGQALGLDDEDLLALHRGGVLHDIGKLGIPDNILMKEGALTDEEWKLIKQHTVIGDQLCSNLTSLTRSIPIIRSHHERWDGGGYPDGLKGNEIPFLAQVFQVVDIYDALSHNRPYKKEFSRDKVIEILEKETANGWRNPELVAVFIELLRTRPEALQLPIEKQKDQAAKIFDNIVSTGVLDVYGHKHQIKEPLLDGVKLPSYAD